MNGKNPIMKKIIYDVGAHNGSDIAYYLLKADLVVAIEANPTLCEEIRKNYANEIGDGRLVVEYCVVTDGATHDHVDFYIHNTNNVLSQFPKPHDHEIQHYTKTTLPARPITEIIRQHGEPYYVKIDIEHFDAKILKALFSDNIIPPYISAESHTIEIFSLLIARGGYNSFKLVDGQKIAKVYKNCRIIDHSSKQVVSHTFAFHSAGPFGEDIHGPWMTADSFFRILAIEDLGWKDIHASRVDDPDPNAKINDAIYLLNFIKKIVLRKMLKIIK
jgi:FkbM family methyltransferase